MSIFRRITEKPWEETTTNVESLSTKTFKAHDRKVALYVFLCVVGSVFILLFAATHMRIALATDWVPMPEPFLLWVNTIVLIAVSAALEYARRRIFNREDGTLVFMLGGLLTVAFLVLQVIVWWQLIQEGYAAQRNPANAFFYVLTALHAAHLLGGLIAWWRALWWMRTLWRSRDLSDDYTQIRTKVDLCAIYWHFLLLVWVIILALFVTT